MKNTTFLSIAIGAGLIFGSCGHSSKGLADGASGDMGAYESEDVNAIVQAKPEIMVIPSDQSLREFGCIRSNKIDGTQYMIRNYNKYLLADENFKKVTSVIQDKFNDADYPLNDFEQALKSLDTQNASDIADNIAKDAKTRMLASVAPDIVLELDYNISSDYTRSSSSEKEVHYQLNAVDAYTNKVVATIQSDNMKGENGIELISKDMKKRLPKLMGDIQKYFNDILTRGREITVRINVDEESNQKLSDQSIEGNSYADQIVDYIKTHTVKGAYKLQTNTGDQLSFVNTRIKILNKDGTQYGVYEWTRDLQKYLKKNLGLNSQNRSQGLGEVTLTIKGM